MAEIPSEMRSSEKEQSPRWGVATIEDAESSCEVGSEPESCCARCAGFGTPGKLSSGQFSVENGRQPRAREIPPAVRARILTERKNIARSKGFARPLRLRNCPFCHVPAKRCGCFASVTLALLFFPFRKNNLSYSSFIVMYFLICFVYDMYQGSNWLLTRTVRRVPDS